MSVLAGPGRIDLPFFFPFLPQSTIATQKLPDKKPRQTTPWGRTPNNNKALTLKEVFPPPSALTCKTFVLRGR